MAHHKTFAHIAAATKSQDLHMGSICVECGRSFAEHFVKSLMTGLKISSCEFQQRAQRTKALLLKAHLKGSTIHGQQ